MKSTGIPISKELEAVIEKFPLDG